MKHSKLLTTLSIISAAILSQNAYAAAFQLYELGAPIIGTAGVGQAAVAEDASTAFYNPAGMALFQKNQFMLGSQMILPYTNFTKSTLNTIRGDNGGNAGQLTPGMDIYYLQNILPKLKFGVSMVSPYGGALNYNDGWAGRYVVQNVMFYTINLNPAISYQVNNWFAVGAGASLEYINLQQTVALPIIRELQIDGQAKISVADFAPGFNLGVMFTPYTSTKIGLAWRSQIVHHLHGNTTFLRIDSTPDTSTKMVMPSNFILSLSHDFSQYFTLLAEAGWANWSSMRNSILTVRNYSSVTTLDWKNTWRAGLGAQIKFNPCFLVQFGGSYDSSPTSTTKRLPDLPMDRQIRIGAGVMYKIIRDVTLGASYEYINFGRAKINNTSADGVLAGAYSRNYGNVVQVSVNVAV